MIEVPVDQILLDRLFSDDLRQSYILVDRLIHLYLILNRLNPDIILDINCSLHEKKIILDNIEDGEVTGEIIDETVNFLEYIISFE